MRYTHLGRATRARLVGIEFPVFFAMLHALSTMAALMGATWLAGPLLGWIVLANSLAYVLARASEVPFTSTIIWSPMRGRRGFVP